MSIIKVPVTKAKGQVIEFDTAAIPEDVYLEALALGMKVLVNRGTSKITKVSFSGDEAKLATAAMAKAQEQVELINTSKIKFTGGKTKKAAGGAVMTEARRLAKNVIKDEMKKAGLKISDYKASEITLAAQKYLDGEKGASILEMAKANLDARSNLDSGLDIAALVTADPKLVAAREAKKKDKPLSAKQAGKTAPRAKKGKAAQATA